jgi:hypothetical protein
MPVEVASCTQPEAIWASLPQILMEETLELYLGFLAFCTNRCTIEVWKRRR